MHAAARVHGSGSGIVNAITQADRRRARAAHAATDANAILVESGTVAGLSLHVLRVKIYFPDGFPNRAASIATLVLISSTFAVYLPSIHVNLYSNGSLMPPTSR
jgi:hypothetical protein